MAVGDSKGEKTIVVENTRVGPQLMKTEDGKNIYIETKITVRQNADGTYIKDSAKIELIQYNGGGLMGVPIRTLGTREVGQPWMLNKELTNPSGAGLTGGQLSEINKGPTQEDIEKTLVNLQSPLNKSIIQHSQAVLSAKVDTSSGDPTPTLPGKDNTQQTSAEALGQNQANDPKPDEEVPTGLGGVGPKSRTQFPGAKGTAPLTYPLSLGSTQQDVLQFNMLEYVSRGITPRSGSGVGARPKTSHRDIIGSVMLPIPGGIQSTNAVKWDEDPADVIQLAFGDAASNVIKGVEGAVTNLAEQARGNTTALKTLIANRFAEIAVGANKNTFLARATGAILNPNLELLFSAPTLRPFEFRFRLSPRSKDEAKSVVQIIRFFQQGMSPRTDGDLLFLKSPHTFQLKYLYRGSGEHPYLNSFKECALKLLQVNYTPENNYSTYEDGVMNSYEMTMQLQELQPVLNSDYDTGEGDAEGFPTNLNFADAQVSTKPGTTDYNPDSGYAPGYAPGDKEGSFI